MHLNLSSCHSPHAKAEGNWKKTGKNSKGVPGILNGWRIIIFSAAEIISAKKCSLAGNSENVECKKKLYCLYLQESKNN